MSKLQYDLTDDSHPISLLPAADYLKEEAVRHGLDETAHLLEVAIEALKEEILERASNAH